MATGFFGTLKTLLGGGEGAPPAGGEVALCACALEGLHGDVARRLRQGEELTLCEQGGEVTALRGTAAAGRLPEAERDRVLGLLRRETRLGCRVVLAAPGHVRVRVSLLM